MEDKDYVSHEVAVLLKEKGFNQYCDKRYVDKIEGSEREEWDDENLTYYTVTDTIEYPEPSLYQAQKWLREKKNMHIAINREIDYKTKEEYWSFEIGSVNGFHKSLMSSIDKFETYEEALNEGIKILLKFI